MVNPLVLDMPEPTALLLFNAACWLLVAAWLAVRFVRNNLVVGRLSFAFAALAWVFYQTPLALFSRQLDDALVNPWAYSAFVNGLTLLLMLYGTISSRLDLQRGSVEASGHMRSIYGVSLLVSALLLSIYLLDVPWKCTGLYALLFDPWLTLLAREFGVKLIGTSLATYSLGAFANTAAPILVLASVWLISTTRGYWRVVAAVIGAATGFIAIGAVLISGTKGLLIPMLLMLLTGAYFWSRSWLSRAMTMVLSVTFVLVSLIGFELFKERASTVGAAYDFAACSYSSGTCARSLEMIDSMKHRDFSLGLPSIFVEPIKNRLVCLCDGTGTEATCPVGTLGGVMAGDLMAKELAARSAAAALKQMSLRSSTMAEAVFNRVFVVPFQVSVWSFMYAETEEFDGLKTLPFARRMFGTSLNMPELVYQKYGTIYSQGDRTSTSTAPTSFFLAYPAYLGLGGFLLALVCIVALDLALARLGTWIDRSLIPLLVGVVLIMSMNFMTSDFVTVLISHGGAFGVALLASLGVITQWRRK